MCESDSGRNSPGFHPVLDARPASWRSTRALARAGAQSGAHGVIAQFFQIGENRTEDIRARPGGQTRGDPRFSASRRGGTGGQTAP